ncbi:SOS response-associated peptidase [Adhaeribacter rhizoryzae]|uniref:Abasic site processing protein n=1 Tax=Adhaeribacter rhizoryzae TaxID=2607907 RepID=A0A5M6CVZ0_9BACT|nr:SOS response-associated peptidase [Adhaeribacter rhizoryzae]KAA5539233.1 SOS response-associated peptidase [Adhaeribacter rhizoryzae]
MCGRYSVVTKKIAKDHRQAGRFGDILNDPNYNAAPSQPLPVITNTNPEKGAFLSWGLLRAWATTAKTNRPINARAETLTQSPMFRNLIGRKRCLVLADGFYEWKKIIQALNTLFDLPQSPGKGKIIRQPYRFTLQNEDLFSFAGLWDEWVDKSTGEVLKTFTIITTEANKLVKEVHERMPVILTPEAEELWLNNDEPVNDLLDLLQPYDADQMKAYPVSDLINSPVNNSPEVINSL